MSLMSRKYVHSVDLYMACTLADAIYVVRGDITPSQALRAQRLEVLGDGWARKVFTKWLNLSPLAAVPSARASA